MAMRIDSLSDLPPGKLRDQAIQKIAKESIQKSQNKAQSKEPVKRSKQGNIRTESNGIVFDSKKEAARYDELMMMLRAGAICDLKIQPQFTLQEAYTTPDGEHIRSIVYKADFSYTMGVEKIVEDVKSEFTRKNKTYRMKRKMMAERLGIIVKEVL